MSIATVETSKFGGEIKSLLESWKIAREELDEVYKNRILLFLIGIGGAAKCLNEFNDSFVIDINLFPSHRAIKRLVEGNRTTILAHAYWCEECKCWFREEPESRRVEHSGPPGLTFAYEDHCLICGRKVGEYPKK